MTAYDHAFTCHMFLDLPWKGPGGTVNSWKQTYKIHSKSRSQPLKRTFCQMQISAMIHCRIGTVLYSFIHKLLEIPNPVWLMETTNSDDNQITIYKQRFVRYLNSSPASCDAGKFRFEHSKRCRTYALDTTSAKATSEHIQTYSVCRSCNQFASYCMQ